MPSSPAAAARNGDHRRNLEDEASRTLAITRVFDAPRALVWRAWTEPRHLAQWSGPRGFTTPHHTMELRPGGAFRACLRSPEGEEMWVRGTYREVVPPERLVFTHAWEGADGQAGPETLVSVSFVERGSSRTEMRFHQALFETEAARDGHRSGWSSSFDRLEQHLSRTTPKETP
jgi:uncharacterized protein YndB with AHSA1/START domain